MSEYEQLLKTLLQFPSKRWLNHYFDLLKRLLVEFSIEIDDPRLGLSLTKSMEMPVNIGQRYVLKPYPSGYLGIIVPVYFEEEAVGGEVIFDFTKNGQVDAKFIDIPFDENTQVPSVLYNACVTACAEILRNTKKTGFRKFHSPLLYDFTMESTVRSEVLNEVKIEL